MQSFLYYEVNMQEVIEQTENEFLLILTAPSSLIYT